MKTQTKYPNPTPTPKSFAGQDNATLFLRPTPTTRLAELAPLLKDGWRLDMRTGILTKPRKAEAIT
jgi:hypothetical protein